MNILTVWRTQSPVSRSIRRALGAFAVRRIAPGVADRRPAQKARDSPSPGASPSPGRPLDGPTFYDDEEVFNTYLQIRRRTDGPARTIEQPRVLAFMGDVCGRSILDLGCGDAWMGRHTLGRGASRYLGLDGSHRMIEHARETLRGTTGDVRLQNLERWAGEDTGPFDIVLSRLALQYIRNLGRLFEVVRDQLTPRGVFVFSVEHPIMTSSYEGDVLDGIASAWRVYDYFREGDRADHWLGNVVLKQHRTFEGYIREIREGGFVLDQLSEGWPDIAHFEDQARYERRLDVPMCVVFRCVPRIRRAAVKPDGDEPDLVPARPNPRTCTAPTQS